MSGVSQQQDLCYPCYPFSRERGSCSLSFLQLPKPQPVPECGCSCMTGDRNLGHGLGFLCSAELFSSK